MELSIVIPAYNESRRIEATLEQVTLFCDRHFSPWEVLVVDDGSTDGTADRVPTLKSVKCLRNEKNSGKGLSVRRGMLEAVLDPILFTDADLSTPIEEALSLARAISEGAQVAIATRVLSGSKEVRRTPRRKLMAAVFRALVKLIVLRGFHDTQCGFKMFRRQAARDIFPLQRLERWGFDVEVLFLARKMGLKIAQVPVTWQESVESRLKLTTPLTMILDLLRIRWNQIRGLYGIHRG